MTNIDADYSRALSSRASPTELIRLAADTDSDIRAHVAANIGTPLRILAALADDSDDYVRRNVAENPRTPPHTLCTLACDVYASVRRGAARNPNTPADALNTLATDTSYWIRTAVANNPNVPASTLTVLSADYEHYVRSAVACNPNTPLNVLTTLLTDPVKDVACNASSIGRVHALRRHAAHLSEPAHSLAVAVINCGFPGWPSDLDKVLTNTPSVTIEHARTSITTPTPDPHTPNIRGFR